jgi:predicted RecB family endonuclease
MKETDRKIGELGNRFGELAEHLVAPSITEKFEALHFYFEHISQNHVIRNAEGRCIAEIDLLLENGDTVMAVEVKAKPGQKDVDEHIGRMEVLRQRADVRHDTRKFQGAIAGAIMSEAVRNYAHTTGFYVIEQTGDTVKITIPENFKPREW